MDLGGLLLFLHVFGLALWLGVTLAMAFATLGAARSGDRGSCAFAYRCNSNLLKGPGLVGMVLTVGSGFALVPVRGYAFFQPFPDHWLFQMQILGSLAFLAAVLYQIPNAERLARAAEASAAAGEESRSYVKFRKRNAIAGSAIGVVLILLIFLGTVRPG